MCSQDLQMLFRLFTLSMRDWKSRLVRTKREGPEQIGSLQNSIWGPAGVSCRDIGLLQHPLHQGYTNLHRHHNLLPEHCLLWIIFFRENIFPFFFTYYKDRFLVGIKIELMSKVNFITGYRIFLSSDNLFYLVLIHILSCRHKSCNHFNEQLIINGENWQKFINKLEMNNNMHFVAFTPSVCFT